VTDRVGDVFLTCTSMGRGRHERVLQLVWMPVAERGRWSDRWELRCCFSLRGGGRPVEPDRGHGL